MADRILPTCGVSAPPFTAGGDWPKAGGSVPDRSMRTGWSGGVQVGLRVVLERPAGWMWRWAGGRIARGCGAAPGPGSPGHT